MPGYKKGQKYDAPFVPYPIPVVLSRKGFFWFIFHYFFLFSTMVSHRFFHSTPWLAPPPWTLILSQRKTTFVGGERYTQNEIHFWQRRQLKTVWIKSLSACIKWLAICEAIVHSVDRQWLFISQKVLVGENEEVFLSLILYYRNLLKI